MILAEKDITSYRLNILDPVASGNVFDKIYHRHFLHAHALFIALIPMLELFKHHLLTLTILDCLFFVVFALGP